MRRGSCTRRSPSRSPLGPQGATPEEPEWSGQSPRLSGDSESEGDGEPEKKEGADQCPPAHGALFTLEGGTPVDDRRHVTPARSGIRTPTRRGRFGGVERKAAPGPQEPHEESGAAEEGEEADEHIHSARRNGSDPLPMRHPKARR